MNTFTTVQSILCDRLQLSPRDIVGKSHLADDLGADSLDRVEIAMDLEDEFGLAVTDENAESFTTVDSVVQFIEKTNNDDRN